MLGNTLYFLICALGLCLEARDMNKAISENRIDAIHITEFLFYYLIVSNAAYQKLIEMFV